MDEIGNAYTNYRPWPPEPDLQPQPGEEGGGWCAAVLGKEEANHWPARDEREARWKAGQESCLFAETVLVWDGNRSVAAYRSGQEVPHPPVVHAPVGGGSEEEIECGDGETGHPARRYLQGVAEEPFLYESDLPLFDTVSALPEPGTDMDDVVAQILHAVRELVSYSDGVRPGASTKVRPVQVLDAWAFLYRRTDETLCMQVNGPDKDLNLIESVVGPTLRYLVVGRAREHLVFEVTDEEVPVPGLSPSGGAAWIQDWAPPALAFTSTALLVTLLFAFPPLIVLVPALVLAGLAAWGYRRLSG